MNMMNLDRFVAFTCLLLGATNVCAPSKAVASPNTGGTLVGLVGPQEVRPEPYNGITARVFNRFMYQQVDESKNWRVSTIVGLDGLQLHVPTGRSSGFVTLQNTKTQQILLIEIPPNGCYIQTKDYFEFDFVYNDIGAWSPLTNAVASSSISGVVARTPTCWPQASLGSWSYIGDCWSKNMFDQNTQCHSRVCNRSGSCDFSTTTGGTTTEFEGSCVAGGARSEVTRCGGELCWDAIPTP